MSKKKLSLADMGEVRKSERLEPILHASSTLKHQPRRGRGRPPERTPYVQLNTRVTLEISQKIDAIVEETGLTLRDVIELAITRMKLK